MSKADLFPLTLRVEAVCCLCRQKKDFISVPFELEDADYLNKMGKLKFMEMMKR